jgi:DNA invertase Pin-like site-specific DNA recombinase
LRYTPESARGIKGRTRKSTQTDLSAIVAQLQQFAGQQGWTIVREYVDYATGKHSDREQFKKMFSAASRREFDVLLFWSLDRLSREGVVETLNHLQRLTGYGVDYRSFTELYLDSTGLLKEAVIGILAAIVKQERVRLSERTIPTNRLIKISLVPGHANRHPVHI